MLGTWWYTPSYLPLDLGASAFQGKKVKAELVDLVKDMSTLYSEIERSALKLHSACQYYSAFVSFMLGRSVMAVSFGISDLVWFGAISVLFLKIISWQPK